MKNQLIPQNELKQNELSFKDVTSQESKILIESLVTGERYLVDAVFLECCAHIVIEDYVD